MLPEYQKEKYTEFYNSARENKILTAKTTLMVHLASAISQGCDP